VLKVLNFLAKRPEGVSSAEVAQLLGKSLHTAYYLLNSLCLEGFAEHAGDHKYYLKIHRNPPTQAISSATAEVLHESMADLTRATRCRAYLWVYEQDHLRLEDTQGHQGQPKHMAVGQILRGETHATASGKLMLSRFTRVELRKYLRRSGLQPFTAHTITDLEHLEAELEEVRRSGVAFSREEYLEGWYGVAAPVAPKAGGQTLIGTLGIAVPKRRFAKEYEQLLKLTRASAFQAGEKLEGDFVWATLFG
jgi:acetyl-CoA synthetase